MNRNFLDSSLYTSGRRPSEQELAAAEPPAEVATAALAANEIGGRKGGREEAVEAEAQGPAAGGGGCRKGALGAVEGVRKGPVRGPAAEAGE